MYRKTFRVIRNCGFKKRMSTSTNMDPPQADVIHKRVFGNRIFILNRPAAYNALDLSMIRNMTPQLQAWNESDLCKVIILKATGNKAFCAGGDVKRVINDMEQGEEQHAIKFFEEEYQLNHLIATLDKPFVSFLDGITSTSCFDHNRLHRGRWCWPFHSCSISCCNGKHCICYARGKNRVFS